MPIRIQHVHKHHQPGDLASFPAAESGKLVRSGVGLVEDPDSDFERELFELQKTLAPIPVPGRVAEIAAGTAIGTVTPALDVTATGPARYLDAGAARGVDQPAPKEVAPSAKEPPKEVVPPVKDPPKEVVPPVKEPPKETPRLAAPQPAKDRA